MIGSFVGAMVLSIVVTAFGAPSWAGAMMGGLAFLGLRIGEQIAALARIETEHLELFRKLLG